MSKRHCKTFFWLAWLLLACGPSQADVVRPALIEISVMTSGQAQIEVRASIEALLTGINGQYKNTVEAPTADEYDVLRKMQADQLERAFKPFQQEFVDGLDLKFDGQSVPLEIASVEIPEPGYTKVPRISVINLLAPADRANTTLSWYYPMRFGDHATRVRQVDIENEQWHWSPHQWIKEDVYTEPFPLDQVFSKMPLTQVVKTYTSAGFAHIIPVGVDHILFVLGIFLLSARMKPLLWQVTMFTLAHSITLSLSMLDIVSLPARIVEPLVALSIAYIGVENIVKPTLHKSRLWIVFTFGLLHGMSFASMLTDFGMPKDDFALALITFNVGIELGQLAVVGLAYVGLALWFKNPQTYRRLAVVPLSALIGMVGLYWFWERIEWSVV